MDNKFYVPFETAKRLKEVGYNEPSTMVYNILGELRSIGSVPRRNDGKGDIRQQVDINHITAPAYHEAVDWLENNWIQFNLWRDRWTKDYSVFINYPNGGLAWKDGKLHHSSSREQALNECILEAIEIVKRRQRLLQQKQQQ